MFIKYFFGYRDAAILFLLRKMHLSFAIDNIHLYSFWLYNVPQEIWNPSI